MRSAAYTDAWEILKRECIIHTVHHVSWTCRILNPTIMVTVRAKDCSDEELKTWLGAFDFKPRQKDLLASAKLTHGFLSIKIEEFRSTDWVPLHELTLEEIENLQAKEDPTLCVPVEVARVEEED